MFSTLSNIITIIWATFDLFSANAFNLDQSKILSFGKKLNYGLYVQNLQSDSKSKLKACLGKPICKITMCVSFDKLYFFNPSPDDKILDWSKLKQIADNILKCIWNIKYVPYRVETIVTKCKIACYKRFLLLSQCFPQLYIFSASKCSIVWSWVKLKEVKLCWIWKSLTWYYTTLMFNNSEIKGFWKHFGKRRECQHFHLFPKCFHLCQKAHCIIWASSNFSSTKWFISNICLKDFVMR